ncbi:DNA-processing protein DprA [Acetilactobacillus jinshanensis]|uniref:DNA-processing protein DprA n=1 Tax=Acetilactobacillus jinshanensis TaxID=1720083 RepID=UPI001EEF6816
MFYRGQIELLKSRCLGVVGARKNSQYSIEAIGKVLPAIIKKGITIVAGLAEGVDTLGHQCAIANQGNTIAVIGTGLDQIYPRFHHDLQKYIEKYQLLITEYPLGEGPRGFHFPARNRIIAGLVETITIVEAKQRSGSLITANLALRDNRNVTAIPGSIMSPLSNGCNELIQEGAKPVCCAKDILEEFYNLTK